MFRCLTLDIVYIFNIEVIKSSVNLAEKKRFAITITQITLKKAITIHLFYAVMDSSYSICSQNSLINVLNKCCVNAFSILSPSLILFVEKSRLGINFNCKFNLFRVFKI